MRKTMRKYIVERNMPDLGSKSEAELYDIASESNAVLEGMDAPYHWVESFITGDKMYCVHIAPDAETIKEHARRGGFPADSVEEVKAIIDPATGNGQAQ